MRVSLVVAADENGVIGRAGGLPWHLPADLARFRRITTGHHLIVGRRTWESFARPLPGRRIVVVTSQPVELPDGIARAGSLAEAFALAAAAGDDEVMVGGGTGIFRAALPRADRVYLTRVHSRVEGDAWFPDLEPGQWREVSREEIPADERNEHATTFLVLERTRPV
jgi:dihydrofolate reductase